MPDIHSRHSSYLAICVQAAGRNNLYRRIDAYEGLNRCRPVHDGHHHIGDNDRDLVFVLCIECDGVRPVGRGDYPVPKGFQRLARDNENGSFVINHQNRFTIPPR